MRFWLGFSCCVCLVSVVINGCSSHSNDTSSTGMTTTGAGSGANGAGGGNGTTGLFDACGGKIVDASGAIDATEYVHQATLWDAATIDCRLGPGFDHYHPGDADASRPTANELPTQDNAGGFLCKQFQFGAVGPCQGSCYGSTSGQVAYAADNATDAGLDRLQTYGWENSVSCIQPVHDGYLGGPSPDPGIPIWQTALGAAGSSVRLPNAIARTHFTETNDAVLTFTNGLVAATGTQTSGDTKPFTQLPANKIPTAVALTSRNEFALVTIWDTAQIKGQIAVFALRASSPGSFVIPYFAAPGEGGFNSIQLLGFVDLPDMTTPTAIAAAGDNPSIAGQNVFQQLGEFGKPVEQIVADIIQTEDSNGCCIQNYFTDVFANHGTVVVVSQWENKVSFVDLAPLFAFSRSKYVDTVKAAVDATRANDSAGAMAAELAFNQAASKTDPWPYDFTTDPSMIPVVKKTLTIQSPKAVAVGNSSNGMGFEALKGWVGGLDGTITAYDVSSIGHPVSGGSTDIVELGHIQADPNITALRIFGAFSATDNIVAVSRGNRSAQWIGSDKDGLHANLRLRDSRLADPVDVDINSRFAAESVPPTYGMLVTLADFAGKQVLSYVQNNAACTGNTTGDSCTTFTYGGNFAFPGSVYRIDTTNVN
jgi:hypothetical protein